MGLKHINFYKEHITPELKNKKIISLWILKIIEKYGSKPGIINYYFTDNYHLHKINLKYLNHDTYTDIITFDNTIENIISGDLFISWDQTKENAKIYGVSHKEELSRVMIHGVFHLLGYGDKTKKEQQIMRGLEDDALTLLTKIKI
jgi:rRNA maturation RNase YbeY